MILFHFIRCRQPYGIKTNSFNCTKILNKKNKSETEFADWSRIRDPDGIAWKFDAKNSLFVAN